MQAIRSIVSMNSYRIPPRVKLVLSRLGSLVLLFQRTPVVQFLFPEANMLGGAAMANSFALAVTTVAGLGAFDSVAGATTIEQNAPINSSTLKDVPAAVGSHLNFVFECFNPPSDPEGWTTTALPANLALTNTYPPNPSTDYSNSITGIPTTPGKYPVTITVWRYATLSGSDKKSQLFNIYVLGFATQPAATTTISSGGSTTLNCAYEATGKPAAATLTYQWYQGPSGTTTTPVGTNSASFTTPTLTSSTNYWVKITSTLSAYPVAVHSNTAVVNVTVPTTVSVAVAPASAAEDGATNLDYTFTRTGATTAALSTNFSVSGTATSDDYAQTGSATFAIGSPTATVTINPTLDTTVEPAETVVLTVIAGAGYTASGTPATGTIANDDTAYSSWASVLPAGQNGASQAPKNDGVTNLMKFACNLDPAKPDVRMLTVGGNGTAGLPGKAMVGGKLRMEFLRRKASTNPGLTYMPQFSSGVGSWTDFAGAESVSELSPVNATWERVVVDDTVTDSKRFGRLKVVKTP
jgi:hypothetical protein